MVKKRASKKVALGVLAASVAIPSVIAIVPNVFANDAVKFAGGEGTLANPYQIATAEQFNEVRNHLDKHFVLVADIDLSKYSTWTPIGGFHSIAGQATPFKGTLDGLNHTIKNINLGHINLYYGLFGYTKSAKISNLKLDNVTGSGLRVAGSLVAISESTTITRVDVTNSNLSAASTVGVSTVVGGIVGNGWSSTSVYSSSFSGAVNVTGSVGYAGGIIANPGDYVRIHDSYSEGRISAGNSQYAGGIVGVPVTEQYKKTEIKRSYSSASISRGGSEKTTYLASKTGATVENSFDLTTNKVSSTANYKNKSVYTSRDWDFDENSGVWGIDEGSSLPYLLDKSETPYITKQLSTTTSAFEGKGHTFSIDVREPISDAKYTYQWQVSTDNGRAWNDVTEGTGANTSTYTTENLTLESTGKRYRVVVISSTDVISNNVLTTNSTTLTVVPQFDGGEGTLESPYLVSTSEQFNSIRHYLSSHFKLTADIDLSIYSDWKPIGTGGYAFTGSLDGDNYTISNLTTTGTGLFSQTQNADLVNFKLENVKVDTSGIAGAVVGTVNGKLDKGIHNVHVLSGEIDGNSKSLGGLVAKLSGSKISQSSVNADVIGRHSEGIIGGLVGEAFGASEIVDTYTKGTVEGKGTFTGGLIGYLNNSTLNKSYTSAVVTGAKTTGGLLGVLSSSATLGEDNFLLSPAVYSANGASGLSVGNIINSKDMVGTFYLDTITINNPAFTFKTGLPVADFKKTSTFTAKGWDFDSVWGIEEGASYPHLVNALSGITGNPPDAGSGGSDEGETTPNTDLLWSFTNSDVAFTSLIPNITVMGGQSVADVTLRNVVWVEKETVVTTAHGDVVLKPDGKGNTVLSAPNGIGTTTTDEVVYVKYKGVNFLDLTIVPTPKLDFKVGKNK